MNIIIKKEVFEWIIDNYLKWKPCAQITLPKFATKILKKKNAIFPTNSQTVEKERTIPKSCL